MRLKKLTSRFPSPRGYVRKTMASDSRMGIGVSARRLPEDRAAQKSKTIITANVSGANAIAAMREVFATPPLANRFLSSMKILERAHQWGSPSDCTDKWTKSRDLSSGSLANGLGLLKIAFTVHLHI